MLNVAETKYHGSTYVPELDKERFDNQLVRLYDVLQNGQPYESEELCRVADVSFSALRNRISDLRVYHAMDIQVTRINNGLFQYQLLGKMPPEKHAEYLKQLKLKKAQNRFFGNKRLWGEYMRSLYAFAHDPSEQNHNELRKANGEWEGDVVTHIKVGKNETDLVRKAG